MMVGLLRNLRHAASQGRLIVRHLLLPGHFDCCYRPVVRWMRENLPDVEFSVRDCVEGALDLLAPRCTEKGIDLLYEIGDGVPGTIRGDATRLRQILVNLLGNAVKFSPPDGVVTIGVQVKDGWVEFRVTDRGRGVP